MEQEIVTSGGLRIQVYLWDAPSEPRGDVLLVHGLAEHMGRYEHVAQALGTAGWRVVGMDFRGHGLSDGRRGHVDAWSDYVGDLRAVEVHLAERYVILGHSMGALVTLDHLRDSPQVRAAALTGPLLGPPDSVPAWKHAAARLLSSIWPTLAMPSGLEAAALCHDEAVVRAYVEDPLVYTTASPRWLTEMIAASARVQAHAASYDLPLWLGWGTEDVTVPTGEIARLCARCPSAEAHPQEGLYHELLNEPDKDRILAEIVAWLDRV